MANLPQSLSITAASSSSQPRNTAVKDRETMATERIVVQLILELSNPDHRENALHELSKDRNCSSINGHLFAILRCSCNPDSNRNSKPWTVIAAPSIGICSQFCDAAATRLQSQFKTLIKREVVQDLAPLIWNSFGTIAALLQEIVSVYPVISPPNLSPAQSNRVCNALALLQYVASHRDTRLLFLNAHLHLYLYPFLKTTSKAKPFEYLRLTSLGVIGALVKVEDVEIISFLLSTEIIPLCLHTMEIGTVLSKTVSTFIIQRVLSHHVGKEYVFARPDRFFAIGQVLGKVVAFLVEQPSIRLLKHVIRCYLLLSEHWRGVEALSSCLPEMFRDGTFNNLLREDPDLMRFLQQLLHKLNQVPAQQAGEGYNHMIVP